MTADAPPPQDPHPSDRKVRVSALAKEVGASSKEVLAWLNSIGEYVKSASSTVEANVAARLRSEFSGAPEHASLDVTRAPEQVAASEQTASGERTTSSDTHQGVQEAVDISALGHVPSSAELRTMILLAFEEARQSGREDWSAMTTAVLKNRLLGITNRSFDEGQWGAASMVDLARKLPDILEVDDRPRQAIVTLREPAATTGAGNQATLRLGDGGQLPPSPPRVRPDLWRAIVDYAQGRRYVWDLEHLRARMTTSEDDNPTLPTLSAQEVQQWRKEFADLKQAEASPDAVSRFKRWVDENLGTAFLPPEFRGEWNGFFREKVIARLIEFFSELGINAPPDLLIEGRGSGPRPAPDLRSDTAVRAFVIACVEHMTADELRRLPISAEVALRASGRDPR